MPSLPCLADRTFAAQNGVEQDEAKHTVDVEKDKAQDDGYEDHDDDQSDELAQVLGNMPGSEGRQTKWSARRGQKLHAAFSRVMTELAEVSEVASADVHFRRQNSDQREARPLSEAETSEELLARVLQGGLYAIDGGNGQWVPSR